VRAFEYAHATTVDEAKAALVDIKGEFLSGGTDLLCRLKDDVAQPDRLVYIKPIKTLAGVEVGDKAVTIGAGTRLVDLVNDMTIAKSFPALHQAALEVGTPQIRNMASVGGNLLQRPRCWYYRNGFGLLGMKDGKSLVRAGDNRYHAIFMTDGDALFTSPSSLATPLIALDATATISGAKGERTIPVAGLYQVPRTDKDRELTIGAGEILTKVTIPVSAAKNATYETRQKQSHDWPLVLCSVCLTMDGQKVSKAKVVIYGVAPIPYRSEAAEQAIMGQAVLRETAEAAGTAAVKDAKPLSMNAYKVTLTRNVVKRALLAAVGNRYWEEA